MNAILKAYTLSQCMDVMAEYALAYEKSGGVNLIFCEDRLTLLAERALLAKLGGTFRSHVATFARFLKTEENTISKEGSVMAVGEVMTRLQRDGALQCFNTIPGIGNNARCIYETLAQLSASEITPEILKESATLLPDDMLKKKVLDLSLIYDGYTEFLRENGLVDESKYLSLLPGKIRKEGVLKGVNVFFLGYNSFTAQAREAIRAVLETAANVIGIFCSGEEEIYANRGAQAFHMVCSEYGKVQVRDVGKPLQGEAEILRKGLFNPIRAGVKVETENVLLFEADDKTAEAEYVATKIRRAMAEKTDLRYRDFSVLVPDVAAYALPLKKAFSEYGIPCFIDEKKSLRRHPVSRFLLDCFRVVRERFSPIAVQSLTQNVLFGESDEYRNYLYKFANYRGGAKRPIKDGDAVSGYDRDNLEKLRERVLLATNGIKSKGHGRDYCAAVEKIREDFNITKFLEKFQKNISDVAQKWYLAQIDDAIDSVLEEIKFLTADKEMTVAEFETVLKNGLDAKEISLIPVKLDAVFVGDITDSRIHKAHTLFAMGMTESVPRASADTAIVSDKEIARLAEIKAMMEPTVAEVNLRARESVCLNLCAFTHTLHLSYPLAADGSEPAVSDVFRYIDRLFVERNGGKLQRRKKLLPSDFAYQCSAVAPAIRQRLIEKSEYEAKRVDARLEYSTLSEVLKQFNIITEDEVIEGKKGQVCVERGEELFFHDGKVSPTGLESYFACPFKNFAEKGLHLKEREEAMVLAVDTGNFIHELLQATTKRAAEFETEEELRAFAREVGADLLKKSIYTMQQDTASGEVFSEKLLAEGVDVAAAAYRQIKNSDFLVEQTEGAINAEFFHGTVDRVDGTNKYVRIIDYKTGTIDDSAASYYTGQKIQLELYMSELKGERIPAGVFYFPASINYSTEDEGRFRMRGFMNGAEDALMSGDKSLSPERETVKSEYFPAALKNGAQTKRVMDEETFRDFLDYSVHVARQGCKELKEGYVAASPYAGSCDYCKYGGMCGFNKDSAQPRKEPDVDTGMIAKIARRKREGGN